MKSIKQFLPIRARHVLYVCGAIFVLAIPVIATSKLWVWKDLSRLLPIRDGVTIKHIAGRTNDWLVSDGTRLYRFDGSLVHDLTRDAQSHSLNTITGIASNGSKWLIHSTPLDHVPTQIWLTDGTTWTDASGVFSQVMDGFEAFGSNGTWYARVTQPGTLGTPDQWDLYTWNGVDRTASRLMLPATIAPVGTGCFSYPDQSTLCTGIARPFAINNAWYFAGGSSQARGAEGRITQAAQSFIWKLDGSQWTRIENTPAFTFVSGVWTGKDTTLIATSNAVTNPFAADHLWLFNGSSMIDLTADALNMGMLSTDARNIKAAWNGRNWMILTGKKLVRFDGTRMHDEGRTRDLFHALASDANGTFVLGGVLSTDAIEIASTPLLAKLVVATEDLNKPIQTLLETVSELFSISNGPAIQIETQPAEPRVGNGKVFAFTVTATDPDDVERVEIYVQGARVKICPGSTCAFRQAYWTNGAATRLIPIFARAVDRKGYSNDSKHLQLVIDTASNATAPEDPAPTTSQTAEQRTTAHAWATDESSGISWNVKLSPSTVRLSANGTLIYSVTASDSDGINKADIWIDGVIKKTCAWNAPKDPRTCEIELQGRSYAQPTDIFVNTHLFDAKGKHAWTTGTRIHRIAESIKAAVTTQKIPTPTFQISLNFKPQKTEVTRGTSINIDMRAQNNSAGLNRVELYVNGAIRRSCTYGTLMSATTCSDTIETDSYAEGTNLSFIAKAIDADGQERWSNAHTVYLRGNTTETASTQIARTSPISVWSWMTPALSELNDLEQTTFSIGAWSKQGIRRIDMIVDGQVKNTCSWSATGGSRECSFTLLPTDFAHGHTATINARVMDGSGTTAWSDARSIIIKRQWQSVPTTAPYVRITPILIGKDPARLELTARGWSGNGTERIEIITDSRVVHSCPAEQCVWTATLASGQQIEYAARLVDHLNQDVWTGTDGFTRPE